MPVDIQTEIEIERPRSEVAEYASNPDNATTWYEKIKAIEWESPKPLAVGSRIAFVAQFLGRRLAYTYEVTEMVSGERFVMRTAEGALPDGDDLRLAGHRKGRYHDDASKPRGTGRFLPARRTAL